MKIDRKTIEKLAYLSQIDIPDEVVTNEIGRLEDMARVIADIKSVDTTGVAPMCNPFDSVQRLRADVVTEENHRDEYQKTTEHVENGLYLVPQVIE